MDEEEIRRREQERLDKKRKKQEERLRKLNIRRKVLSECDVTSVTHEDGDMSKFRFPGDHFLSPISSMSGNDVSGDSLSDGLSDVAENTDHMLRNSHSTSTIPTCARTESVIDTSSKANASKLCSFTIEKLLETPRVPRGRRPNSKYPLVQACKSLGGLGLGLLPCFPITQPMGFLVPQVVHDDSSSSTAEGGIVGRSVSNTDHRTENIDSPDIKWSHFNTSENKIFNNSGSSIFLDKLTQECSANSFSRIKHNSNTFEDALKHSSKTSYERNSGHVLNLSVFSNIECNENNKCYNIIDT